MPTATYEKINTTTLGSAAATISFTSIAGTYTDLRLVLAGTATSSGLTLYTRFNSDTANNYSDTYMRGNGSTAISTYDDNRPFIEASYLFGSSGNPTLTTWDIFSYAGSTYKTCLISNSEDFNGSGRTEARVALWRSTSAITTITLSLNANNFDVGTTATLYGILKA